MCKRFKISCKDSETKNEILDLLKDIQDLRLSLYNEKVTYAGILEGLLRWKYDELRQNEKKQAKRL